jgi:hypothetical protein
MSTCCCTLAIGAPYRRRALELIASAPALPWVVLTDAPEAFAHTPARALRHAPTGPMAADYLARIPATGQGRGAAAYHDKRFALLAALEGHATALYLDADSRFEAPPQLAPMPPGIAVLPVVRRSVDEHLDLAGQWRRPAFEALAEELLGDAAALREAAWCHEALIAVTKDGREGRFFEAWGRAADFLQARGVFSGEGGAIGLAAAYAGWQPDLDALLPVAAAVAHEGGGPKGD